MTNKIIKRGCYSECITMLRFPLAILVVFVHGFGSDINISELHACGMTGMAVYDYVRLFFSVVIARSAVPIFFIISGYLLFLKVEDYSMSVYIAKLRKRWHSLVIPYFLWILMLVLWTLMFKVGGILLHSKPWTGILDYFQENGYLHMLWDSSVWDERTTWLGIETHNSGPILLPFWYMRDLIMMVIISPVIYLLIKKIKIIFLIFMLFLYVFDIRVSWISGTFASAGLFFSIGAYFAIMKHDFTDVLWKRRYLICSIALMLMVYQTYSGSAMGDIVSKMFYPWLVIFQSFALIIVASKSCMYPKFYEANKKLANTSFFIYALHPFILGYIISIINRVMPMGDAWYVMTLVYLVSPLVCVYVCVLLYRGTQKYIPEVLSVLMGRKNNF